MTTHEQLGEIQRGRCGCTGQCGRNHPRKEGCGQYGTFTTPHVAAPADPSRRSEPGIALIPWCGRCYGPAVKRGQEQRAAERAAELHDAQEALF